MSCTAEPALKDVPDGIASGHPAWTSNEAGCGMTNYIRSLIASLSVPPDRRGHVSGSRRGTVWPRLFAGVNLQRPRSKPKTLVLDGQQRLTSIKSGAAQRPARADAHGERRTSAAPGLL